jgi:hypothetical protein
MRIAAYAVSMLLATTLFSAQGVSQSAKQSGGAGEGNVFATSRFLSKGGLGIINTHLYVVVKSARNELVLDSAEGKEERWKGKSATKAQVVVVYEGKVLSSEEIPDRFDLSKSVVISFEGSKIRFFSFQEMSGGYYERISE